MSEEPERLNGHPAKLNNGQWGASILNPSSEPIQGEIITVTTRTGKSWEATIHKVIKEYEFGQGKGFLVATSSEGVSATGAEEREAPSTPSSDSPRIPIDNNKFACPHCGGLILAQKTDDLPF